MDPVTLKSLVAVVRDLGFPIAVAFFVLWRLDRTLRHILDVLIECATKLDALRDLYSHRPPS